MGNKKEGDKSLNPAISAAEHMLNAVAGRSFRAVDELGDDQFDRIMRLGMKALIMQAVAKANIAMESITAEDLTEASVVQRAVVAGILTDKAEKLAGILDVQSEDNRPLTYGDVRELMKSIRGRVRTLEAKGLKLTIDDPVEQHQHVPSGDAFGLEASPHAVRTDNPEVQDA